MATILITDPDYADALAVANKFPKGMFKVMYQRLAIHGSKGASHLDRKAFKKLSAKAKEDGFRAAVVGANSNGRPDAQGIPAALIKAALTLLKNCRNLEFICLVDESVTGRPHTSHVDLFIIDRASDCIKVASRHQNVDKQDLWSEVLDDVSTIFQDHYQ